MTFDFRIKIAIKEPVVYCSKLDYCNSLLYGLPKTHGERLQWVLNCEAHVVSWVRKHDHITSVLATLHWLFIPNRIDFKVPVITFNGFAPNYLNELLHWHYTQPIFYDKNIQALLMVPRTKLKYHADKTFVKAVLMLESATPACKMQ